MINFDNYSKRVAMSILDATPASLIVNKGKMFHINETSEKTYFVLNMKWQLHQKRLKTTKQVWLKHVEIRYNSVIY
jgi:hypothetical protein